MHKVSRMTQTPTTCLTCGRGNTPDDPDTMDEFYAIDLERDVNWGDSTYICKYCCERLAGLVGFVDETTVAEYLNEIAHLGRRIHRLKAALEGKKRRLTAITEGRKALRAEKKGARKVKTS